MSMRILATRSKIDQKVGVKKTKQGESTQNCQD